MPEEIADHAIAADTSAATTSLPAVEPAQPGEFEALQQQLRSDPEAWFKNVEGQKRWMQLYEGGDRPGAEAEPTSAQEHPEPPQHPYTLPAGLEGDPVIDDFGGLLHATGLPADAAHAVFASTFDGVDYSTQDHADRSAAEAELRPLWGAEYQSNVAAINQFLDTNLPPGTANIARAARINGRALFNIPAFVVKLAEFAKRQPSIESTGDLEADIRAAEAVMSSNPDEYRRGALPIRLRSLYAKRGKAAS